MIPSGATTYTARAPYPSVLVAGQDNKVVCPLYRDGALVAPASGTFALLDMSGGTVAGGSVTVAGNQATYTVSAASVPASMVLGEGYQEFWTLVVSGETTPVIIRRAAALAKVGLYPTVADADLIAEYDALADQRVGRMATFQGPIDQAWKIIVERLIGDTRLPYMNRAPTALRETHLHLALAKLFQSFGLNADGNHWRELAKIEHDRYEGAFARISQIGRAHV